MKLTARFLKELQVRFPIIQAPMAGGATTPELVAAVSNAGGLGSLGAGYMTASDIRKAIKKIRSLTNRPFAVNLFIPAEHNVPSVEQIQTSCKQIESSCSELTITIEPVAKPYTQSFDDQMQVILEEQVPIVSFTFGILGSGWVRQLNDNQTIIIGTATTLAEARALEESGVNMIVAQGSEAGGHRGSFLELEECSLINLCSLVPQLVEHISLPIIASGGIMDGRGIAASLALGAAAVQMGTAFLTCPEAGIHANYKQRLLTLKEDSTTLTRAFSGKLARGLQNKFTQNMEGHKKQILDYPIQNALTRAMRIKAKQQGNIDFMSMWAGQSAPMSRGIPAGELVEQLMSEVEENT